jgi:hypothetical protein
MCRKGFAFFIPPPPLASPAVPGPLVRSPISVSPGVPVSRCCAVRRPDDDQGPTVAAIPVPGSRQLQTTQHRGLQCEASVGPKWACIQEGVQFPHVHNPQLPTGPAGKPACPCSEVCKEGGQRNRHAVLCVRRMLGRPVWPHKARIPGHAVKTTPSAHGGSPKHGAAGRALHSNLRRLVCCSPLQSRK